MYSYIKDNNVNCKTAKGIRKNVIKQDLKHANYKNRLLNSRQKHHKMKTIRSDCNQLGNYELNKASLSCFADKRYLRKDGIKNYAYGHQKIRLV